MPVNSFSIARLPRIEFGEGVFGKLPLLLDQYGKRVLLITGASTFHQTSQWTWLEEALINEGFSWELFRVSGEPSPQLVDDAVAQFKGQSFDVVLGIGGGSVLDAAKAIAGLLKPGNSVMDHLEGVGPELPYVGPATPFIAVPTTAGTGSEATKNAVLSVHGEKGFKKSFRDDKLVAEYAVLDPAMLRGCPPELITGNGMDALTQLLESYVSTKANPFTDALAISGLEAVRDSLLVWYQKGEAAEQAHGQMLYAALLSGVTLAQVGLGSVHGLAAPLGAFFPIPHGMACGTMVAEATRQNIALMQVRDPSNIALKKYADLGRLFGQNHQLSDEEAQQTLVDTLADWTEKMALPLLGEYGIAESDVDRIVANSRGSSMKTNPIELSDDEIAALIRSRL
jgi:alcohol dehydrogenase